MKMPDTGKVAARALSLSRSLGSGVRSLGRRLSEAGFNARGLQRVLSTRRTKGGAASTDIQTGPEAGVDTASGLDIDVPQTPKRPSSVPGRGDSSSARTGSGRRRSTTPGGGVLSRLPLITNGEALVALAFVVTGVIIARDGARQLLAAWKALQPYLPFSLPADTPDILLNSFPLILTVFVFTVSSICAVLIGLLWVFGGLADAYRSRKWNGEAAAFEHPELVAEALAASAPKYWTRVPLAARIMGLVWPAARFMSPVSYDTCRTILGSLWKVLFAAIAIAIVVYGLQSLPALVKRFLNRDIILVVPDVAPLYHILILVAAVDVSAALSLVPLRKRKFERSSRSMMVGGQGDPHVLFALLEEGARLLTPKGHAARPVVRLLSGASNQGKGTLVESAATPVRFLGRPAGYICIPLAVFMIVGGFARLIHFNRPVAPMLYSDFLQRHIVEYALGVAFAFAMIIAGLHFAQLARNIFAIRRFQSSLLFCAVTQMDAANQGSQDKDGRRAVARQTEWGLSSGVDDQFAAWAREPSGSSRFRMDVYWADAISETARETAKRHLVVLRPSERLDKAMARILELPFRVYFELEAVEERTGD
ncbi:MAG: hypothetical protein LDL33_09945 [Desulfomonile sp.]|nr:hypothetical protein [Desulfomonile sp.]